MTDLRHPNGNEVGKAAEIRNRAAMWIVKRRDHGNWSEADQAELDLWLAESVAHKLAYLRVEAAWQRADRLGALRRPRSLRTRFAPYLKFGGAGLAAATVVGVIYFALPTQNQPTEKRYVTGVGGRETLTLRDGSRVELNTNTILRIADTGVGRTVWLDKGEAYFQIVHNEAHPFVVHSGNHWVTDLGTKFVVRRNEQTIRVALLEGKARFDMEDSHGSQEAVLNPGDVVVATAEALSVAEHPREALKNELGWRRGLLIFKHATLAEAAAEYNRYNLKKIVIADPRVAGLNINGSLPVNDLSAFTRSIRRFFDLHIEEGPDEIVIKR